MRENEERRIKVKEESKQKTLANEKPFSFYYRDKDKPQKPIDSYDPTKFAPFRAKPAPGYEYLLNHTLFLT